MLSSKIVLFGETAATCCPAWFDMTSLEDISCVQDNDTCEDMRLHRTEFAVAHI